MQLRPRFDTLENLCDEVVGARHKFPKPDALFAALIEDVGELSEAVLRTGTIDKKEALQVACVALRLCEEGDPLLDHGASQLLAIKASNLEIDARNTLAKLCGPDAAARSEAPT